jgi:hypothetical protein
MLSEFAQGHSFEDARVREPHKTIVLATAQTLESSEEWGRIVRRPFGGVEGTDALGRFLLFEQPATEPTAQRRQKIRRRVLTRLPSPVDEELAEERDGHREGLTRLVDDAVAKSQLSTDADDTGKERLEERSMHVGVTGFFEERTNDASALENRTSTP